LAKNYTDRGKTWELANSWWILLTFPPIGMTSFIAFLYTGIKVKNQRWKIYGFIYLAVFILVIAFNITDISAGIFLVLWIVSIVHAFKIRPAYLVQLDFLKSHENELINQEVSKLRQEAEAKFGGVNRLQTQPPQPKRDNRPEIDTNSQVIPQIQPGVPEEKEVKKININLAPEAEIAAIPEIGIILAKKAVVKRQEIGGFQSFEQFAQIMGLKEHTFEKVKPRLVFSEGENNKEQVTSGRVIDF